VETPPQPQNTIEQALTRFVADRFGVGHVGRCPRQFPADGDIDWGVCTARFSGADGDIDWGVCIARFSGADGRVVYRVGHPFSEWVVEATLVRDASRSWHVASSRSIHPSAPDGGEGGRRRHVIRA
jgi:hypothetical protein